MYGKGKKKKKPKKVFISDPVAAGYHKHRTTGKRRKMKLPSLARPKKSSVMYRPKTPPYTLDDLKELDMYEEYQRTGVKYANLMGVPYYEGVPTRYVGQDKLAVTKYLMLGGTNDGTYFNRYIAGITTDNHHFEGLITMQGNEHLLDKWDILFRILENEQDHNRYEMAMVVFDALLHKYDTGSMFYIDESEDYLEEAYNNIAGILGYYE